MRPLKARETEKDEKDLLHEMAEERYSHMRHGSQDSAYISVQKLDGSTIRRPSITFNMEPSVLSHPDNASYGSPDDEQVFNQGTLTPVPEITIAMSDKSGNSSSDEIHGEFNSPDGENKHADTKTEGNRESEIEEGVKSLMDTSSESKTVDMGSDETKATDASAPLIAFQEKKIETFTKYSRKSSLKKTSKFSTCLAPQAVETQLHEDTPRNCSNSFLAHNKNSIPKNKSAPIFKDVSHRQNSGGHKPLTQTKSLAVGSAARRHSVFICSKPLLKAPSDRMIGSNDSLYLHLMDPGGACRLRRRDVFNQSLRPMYRRDVFYSGSIRRIKRKNSSHQSFTEYRASNINLPVLDVDEEETEQDVKTNKGKISIKFTQLIGRQR